MLMYVYGYFLPDWITLKLNRMNEKIKQLLNDCANFIQPYDDGGNEAERLMMRLDEALKQGQTLPIHNVSNLLFCGACEDETIHNIYENGDLKCTKCDWIAKQ